MDIMYEHFLEMKKKMYEDALVVIVYHMRKFHKK